jgi:hypothetical protein
MVALGMPARILALPAGQNPDDTQDYILISAVPSGGYEATKVAAGHREAAFTTVKGFANLEAAKLWAVDQGVTTIYVRGDAPRA